MFDDVVVVFGRLKWIPRIAAPPAIIGVASDHEIWPVAAKKRADPIVATAKTIEPNFAVFILVILLIGKYSISTIGIDKLYYGFKKASIGVVTGTPSAVAMPFA